MIRPIIFLRNDPTEPLGMLVREDILVEGNSLLDPEINSSLKSEDEDEGVSVPIEDSTGQGATGISARDGTNGQ